MDTGCVELLLRDGRKISIDCTGVEDALDVTMAQRSELDYLIYNDSLGYCGLRRMRSASDVQTPLFGCLDPSVQRIYRYPQFNRCFRGSYFIR